MNENANTTETTTPAKTLTAAQKAMRAQLGNVIRQIDEALGGENLNDWEKKFMGDLVARMKKYGLSTRMSAAQLLVTNRCIGKAFTQA